MSDEASSKTETLGSFLSRMRRFLLARSEPGAEDSAHPEPAENVATVSQPIDSTDMHSLMEEYEDLVGEQMQPDQSEQQASPALRAPEEREEETDHNSVSIRELVLASECSVRLRNVAINQQLFDEWTVGMARSDISNFERIMIHVPNLGRKSLKELLELLRTAEHWLTADSIQGGDGAAEANTQEVAQVTFPELPPYALETSLSTAICHFGVYGRLENAITQAGLHDITIEQYLDNPDCLIAPLKSLQGIGKKTIVEAIEKAEAYIQAVASGESASHGAHPVGSSMTLTPGNEIASALAPIAPHSFKDLVAALPERELFVLTKRYGLDNTPSQTLKEIADNVHVTRERVRQLEAKALRQLRVPHNRMAVHRFLGEEFNSIWLTLAGGNDLLSQQELRSNPRLIDPWQRLAMDVAHNGLRGWLAEHALPSGTSWVRNGADLPALDQTVKELEAAVQDRPMPVPFDTAGSLLSASRDQIATAAEHSEKLAVFGEYLCVGRVGARTRRKIRLHALAREAFRNQLFDIASLAELYRRAQPDDDVSSRQLQMEMEDSPHLFCRLFDGIWFALPAATAGQRLQSVPFERDALLRPSFDEGTIGAELVRQLASGPRRHVDLRESVPAAFNIRVAESSVGAILLSNPCFRRVAPGVFDIDRTGDAYDDGGSLNAVFLDNRQARAYCLARQGGAPVNWYPAWGPSFELWLTRWARLHAEPELYRSLLTVVDIRQWSAPNDELQFWQREIETDAQWMLGSERRFELGRRFIEPRQVLATLAQLAYFGWTSWIAINRTTDARGDVHDSADILALLVKAGMVNAESNWQLPHFATDKARHVFASACIEAHENGDLDWEAGVLADIWSDLEAGLDRGTEGWVDNEEFARALIAWQSGEARTSKAFARTATEPVDPNPIFETDEWVQLFN